MGRFLPPGIRDFCWGSASVQVCLVELRFLQQFVVELVETDPLRQGLLFGKEIRSQAQPIPVDPEAHGRQGRGEHVEGRGRAVLFILRGGHRGIDDAVIHAPLFRSGA